MFPPSLTCEEVLALWCSLSLPPGTGKRQREQRMAEVLAAVGLQGQTKTLVSGRHAAFHTYVGPRLCGSPPPVVGYGRGQV